MEEKKPRLPIPTDAEMNAGNAAARKAEGHLTFRERAKAEIEAELLAIENHDEFARIRAEDVARGKAVDQARRDRGQREKVLTEKRRIEAAYQASLKPLDPPNRATVALLPEILDPERTRGFWSSTDFTQAKFAGVGSSAKEELRQHYLKLLLPTLEERAPVWWKVLSVFHEKSPADLSTFSLSNRQVAKLAGVSLRSVPVAVRHLEKLGLIGVVTEGKWSPKGPNEATIASFILIPLSKMATGQ